MPKNTKTNNPQQKGKRRQKLHKNQNNVGNDHNPEQYDSID